MANFVTLNPPPPRATPVIVGIASPRPELQNPNPTPQSGQSVSPREGGTNRPVQSSSSTSSVPPHNFSQPWSGWFRNLFNVLNQGKTTTLVLSGRTLVYKNGLLVDVI